MSSIRIHGITACPFTQRTRLLLSRRVSHEAGAIDEFLEEAVS